MSRIPEAPMKSIRPYKTSEQYLYAMKEDLAEWLKDLYGVDIGVGSFVEVLETGVWLCRHANCITQVARDFGREYPKLSTKIRLPRCGVTCNALAQPGTFQARDNVSNFIQWCRKEMDIKEVLMFETEDLVLRKNEKNFVLCLLEVARRASRFGMRAPTLVQMEEEIEDEIRQDLNLPPDETPLRKPQREPTHFKNLDQMVQHLVSRCTCPVQFSMIKVSEGKYRVGDSSTLIFVRILRKHVMVRVGGGWDTLEHYLDKHDPCRCTSLSHKQALRMASPQRTQATQVQHEITARLTPRTDNPHKPQAAFIVSRSQSPLPPVEWRTYDPHGLGAGWKASTVPSTDRIGTDGSKKAAGVPVSRDHAEPRRAASSCRLRERSATPSGRRATAEERRGSEQMIFTSGRSELDGNMGKDLPSSKGLPCPQLSPRADRLQAATVPPREKGKSSTPAKAIAQRAGTPQPLGNSQQAGNGCLTAHPSSPTKPLRVSYPQANMALTAGLVSGQERVTPSDGWRKNSMAQRSPSPVKNTCQVHKMDVQSAGKVGWVSCRPPTPSKSYRGGLCFRNGADAMAGDQGLKDEVGPQKEEGKTGPVEVPRGRFPGRSRVGIGQRDLEGKRKSGQPCLGGGESTDRPRKDNQKSWEDTKECTTEKERVYTPLPLNLAEEQAMYQSLEEEIMANVKELEADFDDKDLPSEIWSGGFRLSKDLGGNHGPALGHKGPRASTPTPSFLQNHKRVLGYEVPRSGVYVPERETRWHPAGVSYEDVIRELSTTLHREHMETVRCSPPLSSLLVNGTQVEKKVPERKSPHEEKTVIPEAEDPEAATVTGEGSEGLGVNGDTSAVMMPGSATNSSEGFASPEEATLPPNKPKRSLKKPERVPSIYKLKLRPKIRPRRDNRPEKRPSRIPKPVAYRYAQRTTSVKAQGKTLSPKDPGQTHLAKVGQNSSENIRDGGEAELSEHDGERTTAWGEKGVPHDEETWV